MVFVVLHVWDGCVGWIRYVCACIACHYGCLLVTTLCLRLFKMLLAISRLYVNPFPFFACENYRGFFTSFLFPHFRESHNGLITSSRGEQ